MASQRDVMREIFRRHRGDDEAMIREYAATERRGETNGQFFGDSRTMA